MKKLYEINEVKKLLDDAGLTYEQKHIAIDAIKAASDHGMDNIYNALHKNGGKNNGN